MADCSPNTNRFFGQVQQHIKMYQGSFVAVEGPNMTNKMSSLPALKMPYQQVMTARIILRAGQTNYLLNHLGLGDNATFLGITAQYDTTSKFESDNYVHWSYYSNKNKLFSFAQMMVLTGNSENRIEQLYLHNPNQNSPVVLEVMVGVIDEYYDFFTQNEPVSGGNSISYNNLKHTDVALWDSDDSILVVKNSFNQPILYLNLNDINSVVQDGKILTIDETSVGNILLIFITEFDATTARVNITQWIDNYNNGNANPPVDNFEPVITFTSNVIGGGTYTPPLNSLMDDRSFLGASSLSLSTYGTVSGTIDQNDLDTFIVDVVKDYLGVTFSITPLNDITIETDLGQLVASITSVGEYYVWFDISDNIGNKVSSSVNVKINVVT